MCKEADHLVYSVEAVDCFESTACPLEDSAIGGGATFAGGRGRGVGLEEELFIQLRQLLLGGAEQQLAGHRHQGTVIADGVFAERFTQLLGHEGGVAGC